MCEEAARVHHSTIAIQGIGNNACGSTGEGFGSTEYKCEKLDRVWIAGYANLLNFTFVPNVTVTCVANSHQAACGYGKLVPEPPSPGEPFIFLVTSLTRRPRNIHRMGVDSNPSKLSRIFLSRYRR